MKSLDPPPEEVEDPSLPMRGEWIEISKLNALVKPAGSLPMRGEWIEIPSPDPQPGYQQSLPMRGEWIEIRTLCKVEVGALVSPHAGRVD